MLLTALDMLYCLLAWTALGLVWRQGLQHLGLAVAKAELWSVALPGLFVAGALGSLAWMWMGLGPGAGLGLAITAVLILAAKSCRAALKNDLRALRADAAAFSTPSRVLLVLAFVLAAVKAAGPVRNGDSWLYHLQALRWMDAAPAVPGLANLHMRLGSHSGWFVNESLFSLPTAAGPVYAANAALLCLALLWAVRSLQDLAVHADPAGKLIPALQLLLLLQVGQVGLQSPDFLRLLSSPSPDLAVLLLSWWLLGRVLSTAAGKDRPEGEALGWALLGVFAVTVKLSALPLLLVSATLLFWARPISRRGLTVFGGAALLLFTGMAACQWRLSGWPGFPLAVSFGPAPDWQAPSGQLQVLGATIKAWARQPITPYDQVLALSLGQWIGPWWARLQSFDRLLLLLLAAGPLALGAAKALGLGLPKRIFVFCMLGLAGVLFWFFTAPDPRFGYGFLVPAALALWLPLGAGLLGHRPFRWILLALPWLLCAQVVRYGWRHARADHVEWVQPTGVEIRPARMTDIGGILVAQPENSECHGRPEPCTCSLCLHPRLRARGSKPEDGFRIEAARPGEDPPSDPYYGRPVDPAWLGGRPF